MRYHPSREYRTEPSEDSDIAVALFRLAVIIAFTASTLFGGYAVGLRAVMAVLMAAAYTLLLMGGYLARRRWVTERRKQALRARPLWGALLRRRIALQRASAVVIDLMLVSAIIADIRFGARPYLDIYYVIVAVAALWFHREGGIVAAIGAAACVAWVMPQLYPDDSLAEYILRAELGARAVILLTIGLVTGYLARARDAERRDRERIDAELRVARTVQQQMLPERLPDVPGYELAVRFVPAGVVGGDYYDAMVTASGQLCITVADVAGKSIYAVLHLSLLRSHLHDAVASGLQPAAIAAKLNHTMLSALPEGSFIGLFLAALDPDSGKMTYVNAGHTPPMLLRQGAGEEPKPLFTGNIVLGIQPNAEYDEGEETLGEGDCLLCCTDGITEAMDPRWEPFGTEGAVAAATEDPGAPADDIAEQVLQGARRHGGLRSRDDQTVLVVRRKPAASDA